MFCRLMIEVSVCIVIFGMFGCSQNTSHKRLEKRSSQIKDIKGYIVLDFEELVLYPSAKDRQAPKFVDGMWDSHNIWLDVDLPATKIQPFYGKAVGELIIGGRNGHKGLYRSILKNVKVYDSSGRLVTGSK